jgi:hypothetical protein
MSGSFDDNLFAPDGGFTVRIRDLSGGNGAEPLETVRGFPTIAQANEFARRYVRDSIERCRARGMDAEAVLAAWFAFGEDAEVIAKDQQVWNSGTEIRDFAATRTTDPEARNWRVLDPRRHEDDDQNEDEGE